MNEASDPKKLTFRRFKGGEIDVELGRSDRRRSFRPTIPTSARPTSTARRRARAAARRVTTSAAGWRSRAAWTSRRSPACPGRNTPSSAWSRPTRFPSVMGRVCPAPCEDGCNRNEVDDFVGINAVEQYVGDWAIEHKIALPAAPALSGKTRRRRSAAVRPASPPRIFCAARATRVVIFESHDQLGGMMRFGIPGYRTPRDKLDAEIDRILALGGIETRLGVRVGRDVSIEDLERDFDAIFWAIGAQKGRPLPVPGADAGELHHRRRVSRCLQPWLGVLDRQADRRGRRRRHLDRRRLGRAPARPHRASATGTTPPTRRSRLYGARRRRRAAARGRARRF